MVAGQTFAGVAFALDGTDNQDPILGIIVINPNLDALSETKITTQNYDAEFGKAVASVVTAQTKSGSNNFHGSGFFSYSDGSLTGDNSRGTPVSVSLNSKDYGAFASGPIMKDKLFFALSYEKLDEVTPQQTECTEDQRPRSGVGQRTRPRGKRVVISEASFDRDRNLRAWGTY